MSKINVKAFYEKVEGDESLQNQLRALDQRTRAEVGALYKEAGNIMNSSLEELVQIANTSGFEFTADDLIQARREAFDEAKDSEEQESDEVEGCWWLLGDEPIPPPCNHGAYNDPDDTGCLSWYPVI